MAEKKDTSIQIRVSESEKAEFQKKAETIGCSVSGLLRILALKTDNIKIIADGQAVAKAMIELRISIEQAIREDKIQLALQMNFLAELEKISQLFCDILNQTDDLSFGSDVDNEKEGDE